jgi:hypothetical protein
MVLVLFTLPPTVNFLFLTHHHQVTVIVAKNDLLFVCFGIESLLEQRNWWPWGFVFIDFKSQLDQQKN